jgi:hypothetical protein
VLVSEVEFDREVGESEFVLAGWRASVGRHVVT